LVSELKDRAQAAEDAVNRIDVPLTHHLGLADLVKITFRQMGEHHVDAFAGNLAYRALFSLFPFAVFLLSLLGIFNATGLVDSIIKDLSPALPSQATALLTLVMHGVTRSHSAGAFTVGAVISIVVAVWGISGGFRAVMEAMNVMYGVRERRPFWKRYLISIALAFGFSVIMLGGLVLIIAGPPIADAVASHLGFGAAFESAWAIVQWPVMLLFVMLVVAAVYYYAPDVRQRFRFISAGAITAVGLWLLFSLLFTLYVDTLARYNTTYGTLAGIVIFLIYLYYSGLILLIGAEMDHVIAEHGRR